MTKYCTNCNQRLKQHEQVHISSIDIHVSPCCHATICTQNNDIEQPI